MIRLLKFFAVAALSAGCMEGAITLAAHKIAKEITYSFSRDFARDAIAGKYSFPTRKGETDPCGPVPVYRVDSAYRDRALAAVKEQLAKAGVRLAFLLREDLQ